MRRMLFSIIFIIVGIGLLVKGADWLVEGGSALARRMRVSELAIGLTIVAFGTSMPELTVNILSSMKGANDIAIGNIIGSNIANILLILGVASLISKISIQSSTVWKEIPFSLLAAFLVLVMANDSILDGYPVSELGRSDGLALLSFFCIFLWYTFGLQRTQKSDQDEEATPQRSIFAALSYLVVGTALLIVGGNITLSGAISIAEAWGASQALIGLTIVAIGTSLPEMATSIVAAVKGKSNIAVGNIVGSNIFNIFWILGVSSLIHPLTFQPSLNIDLLVVLGATIVLFLAVHTGYMHHRFFFWRQRQNHVIERFDGAFMLLCYIGYMAYVVWRG